MTTITESKAFKEFERSCKALGKMDMKDAVLRWMETTDLRTAEIQSLIKAMNDEIAKR